MTRLLTIALALMLVPPPPSIYNGTNGNDNITPQGSRSVVYSSPGRDYIFANQTDTMTYVILDEGHTLIRNWPASIGGMCPDGRYDQFHWFNANTDTIDITPLGYISDDDIHWIPATGNYRYHYLVVDLDQDSCGLFVALGFRADRFIGTFSEANNIKKAGMGQPFSIPESGPEPVPAPEPQQPDHLIWVYNLSGQIVYEGMRSQMILQPGTYVFLSQSYERKKIHVIR